MTADAALTGLPAVPRLPWPGLPYAAAPAWSFAILEWNLFLLLMVCAADALRKQRLDLLAYLIGGSCFGLVLEYLEVLGHSYTYGPFQWMLGHPPYNIPVCIGAGWGIILYTSRLYSDSLGLPLAAAAAMNTLLALNVDVSMDVVAYRLHMWHWNWSGTGLDPLHAQWFGIPHGNFVGWATVVFCYSAFSRLYEQVFRPKGLAVGHDLEGMASVVPSALAGVLLSPFSLFCPRKWPCLRSRLGSGRCCADTWGSPAVFDFCSSSQP